MPSGKQFYLYVLQTIDRADAEIGGSEKPFVEDSATGAEKLNARAAFTAMPSAFQSTSTPIQTMKYLALIPARVRRLVRLAPATGRPSRAACGGRPGSNPCGMPRLSAPTTSVAQVDPNHPGTDARAGIRSIASRFPRAGIFTPDRQTPPIC
ncbi:MAG: hypothetical protein V9H26_19780 [Verrucomicrobiota bacterium]